jgi:hypothetical protein
VAVGPRWPQFLPDGRRFLFLSANGRPENNGVYLGSLDGREPIRLLAAESAAGFAPPNLLLVVRQGVLRVFPFDSDRGMISGDGIAVADPVGRDGTRRSAVSVSNTGVLAYRPVGGSQRRQLLWSIAPARGGGPSGRRTTPTWRVRALNPAAGESP